MPAVPTVQGTETRGAARTALEQVLAQVQAEAAAPNEMRTEHATLLVTSIVQHLL